MVDPFSVRLDLSTWESQGLVLDHQTDLNERDELKFMNIKNNMEDKEATFYSSNIHQIYIKGLYKVIKNDSLSH